jgi:hypothetical protein
MLNASLHKDEKHKKMFSHDVGSKETSNIRMKILMKQRRIRLEWQTWEKYASLFLSENFVLRLAKNLVSPSFY